jgi:hypothetical protein
VALARLLEVGEDVGQEPGRGLQDVGAQRAHGPQQLAVLDDLRLAAEAALDVAALVAAEVRHVIGGPGEPIGQVFTLHG